MRLTVIGCSDAFGSGGRFNTCFMVEGSKSRVLLDCGASTPVALKVRKVDFNTIDGIVLTHLHGDHFGALPFLMLESQFHLQRTRPLTVIGPPGTRERVLAAMEVFFPLSSQNDWRFPFWIGEVTPGVPVEQLGFGIRTVEVMHQSGAPSTAVRLTDGGKSLVYSGDTEWTDALIPISDGADLFIMECYDYSRSLPGHTNFATLKEKRASLKAKRIMITHMNPSMLARQDEARAAGFMVAEDGLVVDV
jgi:ribonuclease BN (tRNA processing enzyme)